MVVSIGAKEGCYVFKKKLKAGTVFLKTAASVCHVGKTSGIPDGNDLHSPRSTPACGSPAHVVSTGKTGFHFNVLKVGTLGQRGQD